ncbi:hypothetical protein C8Q74DRAFT_1374028 [Fomes fomentarius]|nr:hypothetical protein C8Q74DRAFT_1374028 [Fomes fomentarius]
MSHAPPVLNHDVMRAVVEHAERNTVLSLMLCCGALHQDCVRVLLAEPVYLGQESDRDWSFLQFMSADRRRWQYLRGLIFESVESRFDALLVEGIIEGIRQAPNLEQLKFRNAEQLLNAYPGLGAALASLENVRHLKICGAANHTCLLLESVQWPLVTAELIWSSGDDDWDDWDEADLYARMHPTALLRGAQNTLIRLQCMSWGGIEYRPGYPIYPNLKSFSIYDMEDLRPDEWVKTYPNVSELSVFIVSLQGLDGMVSSTEEAWFRDTRERNMHALVNQCWPRLEAACLSCVAELYILGLPCHIRSLKFIDTTWCLLWLPETMEYAQPVVLELSLHAGYLRTFETFFQQAAHGLRDLEELSLTVQFDGESVGKGMPHLLLRRVNAIRLLPKLRTLTLQATFCLPTYFGLSLRFIPFGDWFFRALFSLAPTLETVRFRIITKGDEIDPAFRVLVSQMFPYAMPKVMRSSIWELFPDAVPSRTIYEQVHRIDDFNMVPGTQIT